MRSCSRACMPGVAGCFWMAREQPGGCERVLTVAVAHTTLRALLCLNSCSSH